MEKKFKQSSSSLWRQRAQQGRGSPKLLCRSISFHATLPSSSLKYLSSIKNTQTEIRRIFIKGDLFFPVLSSQRAIFLSLSLF